LMEGFKVNYSDVYGDTCAKCLVWGAQCGFHSKSGEPVCLCGNQTCSAPGIRPLFLDKNCGFDLE
jgi:hypothetical protein